MTEHGKLAAVDFSPGAPQPGYWRHVEARDDPHHGVEVANVYALPGHLDPELDYPRSVLLLFVGADAGGNEEGETIEPGDVRLKVTSFFASSKSGFVLLLCRTRFSVRARVSSKGVDKLVGTNKGEKL